MRITASKTKYGTNVKIKLSGNDVATAISAWLVARRVIVCGARTITVNGELCNCGEVDVDPSGYVLRKGVKIEESNSQMSRPPSIAAIGGQPDNARHQNPKAPK